MTETPAAPTDTRPEPAMVAIVIAFVVIVSVHLVALGFGDDNTATLTKILIVPTVIAYLWVASKGVRTRLFWLMLAGLGFSWLGDTVPEFLDDGFLVMMGLFACAQVAYLAAFWPYRSSSLLHRRMWLAPYVIAAIAVIALCAPGAGALLAPVTVYALLVGASAVLSTGLGVVAGVGGALFLVSDGMIAIRELPDWGWTSNLAVPIMATYALAQGALAIGASRRVRGD
ncbi:lysoplasmalogenase [Gordonia sp. CPCC 205333]|uniref:lysoplasmalogenase n=1 Tax=Gordonia sp. CPCC 205333 TaxID=3140790 RepID=UPI003AF35E84